MARPPPARPHMAVLSSTYSNTFGTADWAEDDAWDSGSDSDSPTRQPPALNSRTSARSRSSISGTTSSAVSPPRAVPRPGLNTSSSSSTISSSYTHINAPNPSSYPPPSDGSPPTKDNWTMVRKQKERRNMQDLESNGAGSHFQDSEIDSEMVVGDPDPVEAETAGGSVPIHRARQDQGSQRDDIDELINDPIHLVSARERAADDLKGPVETPEKAARLARARSIRTNRRMKFINCLSAAVIDLSTLRKLAWNGVPKDLRPLAWPLLLGYIPLPSQSRQTTLARKRAEYASLVEATFSRGRDGLDQQIWHQIEIDVPRTRPGVRLWMHASTQRSLERILYVWAIRHQASGYVQGINDLATPFFQVFLSAYIDSDPAEFDPALLPAHALNAIEADSFWCLSKLLDGIQDNYIASQPGIQRSVKRMSDLVARIDPALDAHLKQHNVEYMQFAFRWMNCLLMREVSVECTVRMWDTYLAEGTDAFSQFHLYVCAAFLVFWSDKLLTMDFQGIIMFLQSLPTQDWTDDNIEYLLSRAFVLSSTWANAQSHFVK